MKEAPTILIIFGVTGDLSRKKLIPAIFDLYAKELLPKTFKVVGFSRKEKSDDEFREFVKEVIDKKQHWHSAEKIEKFLESLHYEQGLFDNPEHYERLAERLISLDKKLGKCSSKLFYLATPPDLYSVIFKNLAESGLSIPCPHTKNFGVGACSGEEGWTPLEAARPKSPLGAQARVRPLTGWTRILVEKPFGKDLETAQELDRTLGLLFKEEQIFRIDHYLAKETIQNILTFRFSNKLFEPIWDKDHIEKVEIKFLEEFGIDGRGSFYEDVGALRDVGQNHMLQMLTSIAMENPGELAAKPIRKERAKILEDLKSIKLSDIPKCVVRAQYEGYREEPNVDKDSETETYFRLEAYVDNKRWKGVPFILESGKKMKETKAEISVYFKESTSCLCPPEATQHHQNVLTFRIQPDEGISILFWAKKPGFSTELDPKMLSFSYKDSPDMVHPVRGKPPEVTAQFEAEASNGAGLPDAYERILFDCIRGDQILFTSTEEVNAAWKFITPIVENWGKTKLYQYKDLNL